MKILDIQLMEKKNQGLKSGQKTRQMTIDEGKKIKHCITFGFDEKNHRYLISRGFRCDSGHGTKVYSMRFL